MMNRLTILFSVVWLLGLLPSGAATAQVTADYDTLFAYIVPPVRLGDAAWGDYDRDGDFDLIVAGRLLFTSLLLRTQLYLNEGDSLLLIEGIGLVEATVYVDALDPRLPTLEDVWQSAVAWGDYDNDGDLDLAVTGVTETEAHTLRIYENTDDDDRFASRFVLPGVRWGDLAWSDYDNDGDLDFVICGTSETNEFISELYENQTGSGGGFIRRDAGFVGLANCAVAWGDYDNDGDHDLLITGVAEPQAFVTRLYRNDGTGGFTDARAGLKGLLYASVAWGDYDADGDLDILLSGASITPFILEGQLKIYRNHEGRFTDASDRLMGTFENDVTPGLYHGAVAWGDYDGDGYLDFLVAGVASPLGNENLQVYNNDRYGHFTKSATERFDGGYLGGAFWGDYDGDNDLDMLVWGQTADRGVTIRPFRNKFDVLGLPPGNAPPMAPDRLQATPQGDAVTLSWEVATDGLTPAPGLTYNLRVGTTPGGSEVVSPMAVPETGHRLLPEPGNTGHNTWWSVRRLPPGTYYWSVQAIDTSFKGSLFASEVSFTIRQ